ncbi:23S rRNA (guanosine(2251)-2'-O)-methyltransferase RlmB [Desulfuribacillus alkaliarsenatis]|nr:23S rRNA (guanosine(2251)-2'-O)-methyltransferase RlmB [Desulfuribacillus alkaliarsenatis]
MKKVNVKKKKAPAEPSLEENNELQLEGKNPIVEALRAGQQVDRILIAEGARQVDEIKQLASENGVKYQFVTRQKLDQIATTKAHQGLIAFLASVTYTDFDSWISSIDISKNPVVLVLAELQDPQNVGSIIRTAESAGVAGVIIAKHRAVGLTATVAKASAGAIAHMPIIRVTNLANTIEDMKKQGFWVVGTDARADKNYYEISYDMPTILVIGSEGKGIGPLLEKKCDYLIKIPMLGKVTSLNASVATGIMTYEIVKQRLSK